MQPTAAAAAQEAAEEAAAAKQKAAEEFAAEEKAAEEKARTSSGSSASSALAPPTPGYETAKGWNALPPAAGDVEGGRPTKTTTDETVGVDLPTPHNGDDLELQSEAALPPPVPPQSTGEQLPGMEASRLFRMASLGAASLGDGAGKENADAPLADRALTTINRSQSAQL